MSGTRRWRENERGNARFGDNLKSVARPDGSIPIAPNVALVPSQRDQIHDFTAPQGWMTAPVVLRIRCDLCGGEWAHVRHLEDGRYLLKIRNGLAILGESPNHRYRFQHCGAVQLVADRKLTDLAGRGTGERPSRQRIPRRASYTR